MNTEIIIDEIKEALDIIAKKHNISIVMRDIRENKHHSEDNNRLFTCELDSHTYVPLMEINEELCGHIKDIANTVLNDHIKRYSIVNISSLHSLDFILPREYKEQYDELWKEYIEGKNYSKVGTNYKLAEILGRLVLPEELKTDELIRIFALYYLMPEEKFNRMRKFLRDNSTDLSRAFIVPSVQAERMCLILSTCF